MSGRSLAVLAALVVLLAGGLALHRVLSRPPKPKTLVSKAAAAGADRVDVSGPLGAYALVRSSSGTWSLAAPISYPAAPGAVSGALAELPDATLSDALSASPARWGVFGLTASSATKVTLSSSSRAFKPASFLIGSAGPDMNSAFVRFPGRDDVVEATGLSPTEFARPASDWLDKSPCGRALSGLQSFSVRSRLGRASFSRVQDRWRRTGAKTALSTAAATSVLQPAVEDLQTLSADKLIFVSALTAAQKRRLKRPALTLVARAEGEAKACTLEVGAPESSGGRLARRDGEGRVVFQLADWRLSNLLKPKLYRLR
jgi:Domain of unknown function (DUF4340)